MVGHDTARQKFRSYKTEEALQVEPQSNPNFYGSARHGTTYKTGLLHPANKISIRELQAICFNAKINLPSEYSSVNSQMGHYFLQRNTLSACMQSIAPKQMFGYVPVCVVTIACPPLKAVGMDLKRKQIMHNMNIYIA